MIGTAMVINNHAKCSDSVHCPYRDVMDTHRCRPYAAPTTARSDPGCLSNKTACCHGSIGSWCGHSQGNEPVLLAAEKKTPERPPGPSYPGEQVQNMSQRSTDGPDLSQAHLKHSPGLPHPESSLSPDISW